MTQTAISHDSKTLTLTQEPYPDTVSRRIGEEMNTEQKAMLSNFEAVVIGCTEEEIRFNQIGIKEDSVTWVAIAETGAAGIEKAHLIARQYGHARYTIDQYLSDDIRFREHVTIWADAWTTSNKMDYRYATESPIPGNESNLLEKKICPWSPTVCRWVVADPQNWIAAK